jgi:hypothetical protein
MLREFGRQAGKFDRRGQNAVEYLLVFGLVVVAIAAALAPGGFMTRAIDNSFNIAINSVIQVVNSAWP